MVLTGVLVVVDVIPRLMVAVVITLPVPIRVLVAVDMIPLVDVTDVIVLLVLTGVLIAVVTTLVVVTELVCVFIHHANIAKSTVKKALIIILLS